MTEVFQCRVDSKLVAQARRVAKEIGTTPAEVVRLMFAQMVKRRAIPFPLQADSPEDEALGPSRAIHRVITKSVQRRRPSRRRDGGLS